MNAISSENMEKEEEIEWQKRIANSKVVQKKLKDLNEYLQKLDPEQLRKITNRNHDKVGKY